MSDAKKTDEYCVKDSNAEPYMYRSSEAWKYDTLHDCCVQYYHWKYRECMGDSSGGSSKSLPLAPCPESLPEPSGLWYVKYYTQKDFQCVRECIGEFPCMGRASSYVELYATFHICCDVHTSWKQDCSAYNENATASCDEDFWDSYYLTEPEMGYYPNGKSADVVYSEVASQSISAFTNLRCLSQLMQQHVPIIIETSMLSSRSLGRTKLKQSAATSPLLPPNSSKSVWTVQGGFGEHLERDMLSRVTHHLLYQTNGIYNMVSMEMMMLVYRNAKGILPVVVGQPVIKSSMLHLLNVARLIFGGLKTVIHSQTQPTTRVAYRPIGKHTFC